MSTSTLQGIITRVHPSHYEVKTDEGTYQCSLRGNLKREKRDVLRPAAAGDRVEITVVSEQEGAIEQIKERTNKISRRAPEATHKEQIIAANIDQFIGVQSFVRPELTPTLLDHGLAAAEQFEIPSILICFNKIDLVDDPQQRRNNLPNYEDLGYPVLLTSAEEKTNIQQLRNRMKNNVSVLVGPSGVGKTSLLNALNPELDLDVGRIGRRTEKGTHRTTTMSLLEIEPDTFAIDTPGVDFLSFWESDFEQVQYFYPDLRSIREQCKFDDCLHLDEPGCAVKEAVETGSLHPYRYESYQSAVRALKEDQLH